MGFRYMIHAYICDEQCIKEVEEVEDVGSNNNDTD